MSIAFVSSTQSGNLTYSFSTSGPNRLLVVATRGGGGDGDLITGIKYAGQSLTKVDSVTEPGDLTVVSLWFLLNPTLGSNDLVISPPSIFMQSTTAQYTAIRQALQTDANTTKTASNISNITTSLTTGVNNAWTILACSQRVSTTAGSGSTKRSDQLFDSGSAITPAGSYSMNIGGGDSGTDWGVVMASFSPAIAQAGLLAALM